MLYRKNFSKRYKYQQHHQPLSTDSMALLLAPLLLSMLSLTTSATMDSEFLDRIDPGEMMDYIVLPSPPNAKIGTIGLMKVGNPDMKRTDGRIRILGKRNIFLSK